VALAIRGRPFEVSTCVPDVHLTNQESGTDRIGERIEHWWLLAKVGMPVTEAIAGRTLVSRDLSTRGGDDEERLVC
jgi:hypothetical protein